MGSERGRPNLYWMLVKAVDNQKRFTVTQIVSKGVEQGFFQNQPFITKALEETKKEARHALVTRARRYKIPPDEWVVEGVRANVPAYFGWRFKLSFDKSFFTEQEYAELQALKRSFDASAGEKTQEDKPPTDGIPEKRRPPLQMRKPPFFGHLFGWTAVLLVTAGLWKLHQHQERQRELAENGRKMEPILTMAAKNDGDLSRSISLLRGFLYNERNPQLRAQIERALSQLESKKLFAVMEFPGELSYEEPIAIIPSEPRVIIYDSLALTRGSFINQNEFILDFDAHHLAVGTSAGNKRTIIFSRVPMILARR